MRRGKIFYDSGGRGSTSPISVGPQFYASQAGGGTGLDVSSPATVAVCRGLADAVASQGPTINMANGTYTGANSMITPTIGVSGTPTNLYTYRATNEGQVTIDGQGVRVPVTGNHDSDYYSIIGINCKSSSASVIAVGANSPGCDGWEVKRCMAWDAAENKNAIVIAINYGVNNLIEDCAAFGTGRKSFISYNNAGPNIFRRCWGRWQRSFEVGPKQGISLDYNSYQTTVENCLLTWDDSYLTDPYTLVDASGLPYPQPGLQPGAPGTGCTTIGLPYGVVQADQTCSINSKAVEQPYGCISMDRLDAQSQAFSKLLGSIAYQNVGQTMDVSRLVFFTNIDQVTIRDTAAIYPTGYVFSPLTGTHRCFQLAAGIVHAGDTITNATAFTTATGDANSIHADWVQTNVRSATQPSALYSGTGPNGVNVESLYNTNKGAQIQYRYVNGILTGTKLWPWPMNQRIIDATTASGYTVEDINTTIQGMFGAFI